MSSKVFTPLGASNHTGKLREVNDFYATDPAAAEWLLRIEDIPKSVPIWECCAGEGHLAEVFKREGYHVRQSDLIVRAEGVEELDFLSPANRQIWCGYIITNPPYCVALESVAKALSLVPDGMKVMMFLKLTFLEGKQRRQLYEKYPPKTIWVSSSRLLCAKNADFAGMKKSGGSAIAYAWYVWEKGYKGDTILKWFN